MILFFIRKYNDVDHIVPIVHKMSSQGTECVILSQNHSMDIDNDFRLKYLRDTFNVKIDYVYNAYQPTILHKVISYFLTYLKNSRFGSFIVYRFIFRNPKHTKLYSVSWAQGMLERLRPTLLVFDYVKKEQHITGNLVEAARSLNLRVIAVPHGLNLTKNRIQRDAEVEAGCVDTFDKKIGYFDYIVACFEYYKEYLVESGIPAETIKVLGSVRYCTEWRQIYRTIIPRDNYEYLQRYENGKLKVVFMEYPYNYRIDKNVVIQAINKIAKLDYVQLIIKPQTRSNKLYAQELKEGADIASEIPSFVLCEWADVVIGTSSSILLEPLLMDKLFIYPKYFHANTMFYETYNACCIVNSDEEFIAELQKIADDKTYRPYTKEAVDALSKDIIYGGKERDVLGDYSRFISGVAHKKEEHDI